jgi:large subunit ribosomal protein L24
MATKKQAKQARRAKRTIRIMKGDRVKVIRGNFREVEGTVLRVDRQQGRVVVEGVNMRKKHQRPTQDNPDGGIITMEMPVDVSNVMLIDPASDQPSRVRIRVEKDGTKERIAVKTGNPIPKPA